MTRNSEKVTVFILVFKDIPGTSEQIFWIVWYCYRSLKQL